MGVIGRREFELIMKMDDQTRKERESLNRGLGDIERTSKRASAEANRSIVDIAKQSKQSMEGIKAVMELGGWLAMANMVGTAFMNITEEARKNSQAFKEAGASLDVVGKKIGTGLVKAMEPLAEGFKQVMRYGTAVFENFPEVAMATFTFVKAIITKTLSWDGLSAIFTALARGIFSVFSTSFQYIPKIFMEIIGLLFSPVAALGQYIIDVIKNALSGKKIEDPFTYLGRQIGNQLDRVGALASTFGAAIAAQVQNAGKVAAEIGAVYSKETADYTAKIAAITKDSMKRFDKESLAAMKDGEAAPMIGYQGIASDPLLKAILSSNAVQGAEDSPQRLQALRDAMEQARELIQANLAGKNGVGAAVSQNLAGTELMSGFGDGGPMALISKMFGDLSGTLGPLLQLLNPLKTIFASMMEVLTPLIGSLLAPLVDILQIIGKTIGAVLAPALELLRPIIEVIAELFNLLYTYIIKPIANLIIMAFNLLYNGIAGFLNGIIWLVNTALGWTGFHMDYLAYRDMNAGTLKDATTPDGTSTGGSGSGGSASYAAGTSITIEKIEIKADFIAGDAGLQDVAVMLRDKLLEAERAGR